MEFQGFDAEVASIQAEMQSVYAQAAQVRSELNQSAQATRQRITKSTDAHQQFATKWGQRLKEHVAKVSEYDRMFDVSSSKIDF